MLESVITALLWLSFDGHMQLEISYLPSVPLNQSKIFWRDQWTLPAISKRGKTSVTLHFLFMFLSFGVMHWSSKFTPPSFPIVISMKNVPMPHFSIFGVIGNLSIPLNLRALSTNLTVGGMTLNNAFVDNFSKVFLQLSSPGIRECQESSCPIIASEMFLSEPKNPIVFHKNIYSLF